MEIVLKEWKIRKKKNGSCVVQGEYAVMSGGKEVASQSFNEEATYGASTVDVAMPTEVILEIESLTTKINEAVKASF